jgi:hypothetical protein
VNCLRFVGGGLHAGWEEEVRTLSLVKESEFDAEQNEILNTIERMVERNKNRQIVDETSVGKPKTLSWGRFNGDFACRVVKAYLQRHICPDLVVGPGAFTEGYPVEFDLLILRSRAGPARFTNCYPDSKVRCVVEVKLRGPAYVKRGELQTTLARFRFKYDRAVREYPHLKCVCLCITETTMPKSPRSIDYFEETRKALQKGGHRAFCLKKRGRAGPLLAGRWKNFVRAVGGR